MSKFKNYYKLLTETNEYVNTLDLLLCGGIGSHIAHPYDILSPEDFLDFFDKLLKGELETIEKVDGVNIFWGIENNEIVFSRNKTEKPIKNIEDKFSLQHPAGDTFRAGCTAIKEAISKLSKKDFIDFDLTDENGNSKYFINTEILYGEIPNIIQYSDIYNYIVFHSYHENIQKEYIAAKEADNIKLDKLAKKIGEQKVESIVVNYFGDIDNIKVESKVKESTWIFKGPINVSKYKISKNLEYIATEFKKYPEVEKLKNWKNLTKDELFDNMKKLSEKVGLEIITGLSSELFTGKKKTPESHPGIEGLVVRYGDDILKVTGDFRELNQKMWQPLRDMGNSLKDVVKYILNNKLMIKKAKISQPEWEESGRNYKEFLVKYNPKFYSNDERFTENIEIEDIINEINKTLDKIKEMYVIAEKDKENIKREEILKAFRIANYKLTNFKNTIKKSKNRIDIFRALILFLALGEYFKNE